MAFEQELQALPHGREFRFVEKMISLTPGQEGVAEYQITGEEEFLKGHFPGRPLWPGVIMIEAIAQLGGVVAQSDPEIPALDNMLLTSVKNAKILGSTTPGATLTIRAKVQGRLGSIIQISGEVLDGDTKLASGIVMLSGTEKAG
ncbi:3-hydroxyacyl-ACP dehydratase FabZ family protein [Verrucomicrobiaceae bacterium 227]